MRLSDAGLQLIAKYEGFAPYLYDDPVGYATVGYGFLLHESAYHRPRGVCPGAGDKNCDAWPRQWERELWISADRGRELLKMKAKPYGDAVFATTRALQQGEFDALTSLCFNIGPGGPGVTQGYYASRVRADVNAGRDPCPALRQIVYGVNDVKYQGLVNRREAECALFHSNVPLATEEEHMPTQEYRELYERDEQIKTVLAPAVKADAFIIEIQALLSVGKAAEAEKRLRYVYAAAGKPWPA